MKFRYKEKKTKWEKRGDKLEVKLRDGNYNPIYKKEVSIMNLKQLVLLYNRAIGSND